MPCSALEFILRSAFYPLRCLRPLPFPFSRPLHPSFPPLPCFLASFLASLLPCFLPALSTLYPYDIRRFGMVTRAWHQEGDSVRKRLRTSSAAFFFRRAAGNEDKWTKKILSLIELEATQVQKCSKGNYIAFLSTPGKK